MTTTNLESGTRIDEIDDRVFRIHTPFRDLPGGFSFNQYLVVDDEPLLFHTGLRKMFPLVRQAIEHVMPVSKLRWVSFAHFEADEVGALNELLALAPRAEPLCSVIGAMVSVDDFADRPAHPMADGETLSIGARTLTWIDTPQLPHGWDSGLLSDIAGGLLFCGDLFTQPGADHVPLTEDDILGPSEAMRASLDYFSHTKHVRGLVEKLARTNPRTLACMHGAAWRGDGAKLLRALADELDR